MYLSHSHPQYVKYAQQVYSVLSAIYVNQFLPQNLNAMNYYFLTAGIVSMFAVIGHFTIGRADFLIPVLNANIDEVSKKVMHNIFQCMSVFMILTTILLIYFSFDDNFMLSNHTAVVQLIGITYAGFVAVQLMVAITSSIQGRTRSFSMDTLGFDSYPVNCWNLVIENSIAHQMN